MPNDGGIMGLQTFVVLMTLHQVLYAVEDYSNESYNGTQAYLRKIRWDYETGDDYSNEKVDYDDETNEQTRIKKLILNWEKIALRLIFILAVILLVVCCCWHACRQFFTVCCKSWYMICRGCFNWLCFCCMEDSDPMYQQVKMFSEQMGLKISYETYKQLKEGAVDAAAQGLASGVGAP